MSFFQKILFTLILLSFSPLASATMALPLTVKQMTKDSGKIFVGECLQRYSSLDENNMPSTYLRWRVVKALKGVPSEGVIETKLYGGEKLPLKVQEGEKVILPLQGSAGISGFEVGGEYLLFFYPESSLGFTSPVGGGQGKFQVLFEGDPKMENLLEEVERWL